MSNFPQGTLPRLIQIALAEVGTAETGNNETKYGKHMKADKLPWCGSFLNWCADQAGVKVPNVVSTRAGAEAFQKVKQWHTTPKIGDFVFFDFIINNQHRNKFVTNLALSLKGNSLVLFRNKSHGRELNRVTFD